MSRRGLRLAAVLLELAKQGEILFDAALDAGFVEREELEVFAALDPDAGLGECYVAFLVAGEGVVGEVEAKRKDVGFDGGGALETPAVVDDGLGEVGFEGALGRERLVDAAAVLFVGGLLGGRDHEDLAGEAVPVGVEGASIGWLHGSYLGFIGAWGWAGFRGSGRGSR